MGLAALKNGEIRGTVYNDKEGQAEKMFDLAFCLARGLPLDDLGRKSIHLSVKLIDI